MRWHASGLVVARSISCPPCHPCSTRTVGHVGGRVPGGLLGGGPSSATLRAGGLARQARPAGAPRHAVACQSGKMRCTSARIPDRRCSCPPCWCSLLSAAPRTARRLAQRVSSARQLVAGAIEELLIALEDRQPASAAQQAAADALVACATRGLQRPTSPAPPLAVLFSDAQAPPPPSELRVALQGFVRVPRAPCAPPWPALRRGRPRHPRGGAKWLGWRAPPPRLPSY